MQTALQGGQVGGRESSPYRGIGWPLRSGWAKGFHLDCTLGPPGSRSLPVHGACS